MTASTSTATLTFLGAAGTVTGSKTLLTVDGRTLLVDAGLFQGEKTWRLRNWEPFPVSPRTVDAVVLTHAHLDHCGYLPALVREGFAGPVWCTEDTRRLAEIVLRDSAYLQESDAAHAARRGYSRHHPPRPLYTVTDVEQSLPLFRTVDFDEEHLVDPAVGLQVRMTRAGHILGSASVSVTWPGGSVLFSGDLGRVDHPVLRSRDIPPGAHHVVVESTYGDREHPDPDGAAYEKLADAVRRTTARGGTVLVPAFAVDRTEVVLQALSQLRRAGRIPDVPVIVNSPMALAALRVYRQAASRGELRPDLRGELADLPTLREARTVEESRALNRPRMPCVIISSSGMTTGGRVVHHLRHLLPDRRNTVVLTGYQAVGTRGRALAEGAHQVKMHGEYVPVRAEVVQVDEFSVHADASDLLSWVAALEPAPRTVLVNHGEADSARALARRIDEELGLVAVAVRHGEVVSVRH
ncbi:MBL fold metallo-hydrolase RNA specificity domain-containing protein [Ornithinimicrobium pekingense]|uniref:MBL fold hydrolase n=1 Tax=Ornithinimicrobium pekingense TaxID=384677 RepID=A0ABQ2F733_9MICO|nr:MBL fold metallo-hydrolase [Ornithinimicrobium pekingense]GGK68398.1 MBL fold hydrolase [Ornithinimicrobium pekingense]